ncbi:MAG: response regulator [Acidobacteriota bacterium]|nr:response regulator [Acidobacteriota bacterium]
MDERRKPSRIPMRTVAALLTAGGILLALGWWVGKTNARREDSQMRANLLRQVQDIAGNINSQLAKRLTFTEWDKDTPAYEVLCEQMIAFGRSIRQRGIYSMALRGGKIIFGPENYPKGDPMASPPGTVYDQPSPENFRIFQDKRPTTLGPVTDEYGTFISALAPVLDPHSGEVLMVVGLDILAGEWQARLRAVRRAPLPAVILLALLLAGGVFVYRHYTRLARPDTTKFKTWVIVPAALTVAAAMAIYAASAYQQYRQGARQAARGGAERLRAEWSRTLRNEARLLKAQIDAISVRPDLQRAWRDKNRTVLTDLVRSSFDRLNLDYNITQFNFIALDRTMFLRVHRPGRQGDVIARSTLNTAVRTDEDAWGIETDAAGVFTLRYVKPWKQADRTLGYLELVLEAGSLAERLARDMRLDLLVVVRKRFTPREKYEEERRLLGLTESWDTYADFAVINRTTKDIPPEVAQRLNRDSGATDAIEIFDARLGDKRLACGVVRLDDAAGRNVTDFIVMGDVTAEAGAASSSLMLNLGFMIALFGGVLALIWSITSAAERRLGTALVRIKENESRTRALTNAAQDAIMTMDPEGRISFWNPAAERILGYSKQEAIGRVLHDFIVPDPFRDTHRAAYPAFLETGQGAIVGKTLDLEALRKDGRTIDVQMSLSAVHQNEGWNAIGILRDITDRKRAEEGLRESNRRLEAATARAKELAAQAEAANRAKSEFLANMSHEIRTPMNGIIGMTGLLLDTDLTPEQRQFAQIVRGSGEALLALINDILDFSKIEAHKMELETLDFDLRAVMEDTAELLAVKAHPKGLDLISRIDPDVPVFLRGDPGRLRQIITNLGDNAIKFTARGEVSIRVSLQSESEKRALVRFAVTDTGIGIPRDKQAKLFSPFTQVDGSTTRKYGGTGLGLAISKQIAEMMGGTIALDSEEGRGSSFWLTADFEKRAGPPAAKPQAAGIPAGARILVVDDNATNRLLVKAWLKKWGCRFDEAVDGPAALALLEKGVQEGDPYLAALVDALMPGMDGWELGRRINESPALRGTHLIMMTSMGGPGESRPLAGAGFTRCLAKPLRPALLRESLARVLGSPETAARAGGPAPAAVKRSGRILLAEDNATNQIVALKILEKLGYRAEAVANGREAVEALRTIPYDVVLMDCQMPEMDGFEATRRIRELGPDAPASRVPIIAMTAHAMKGDREKCLAAGMDDYLSKPVRPEELAAVLEHWLNRPETDSPTEASAPAAAPAPAADSASPDVPVFDKAGFLARLSGDEELARTISGVFQSDMPAQIEQLAALVAAGDGTAAGRQAHKIKGAAAGVGGEAMRATAFEMEKAGQAGRLDDLRILLPELEARYARLREAMDKDLGSGGTPPEGSTCAS